MARSAWRLTLDLVREERRRYVGAILAQAGANLALLGVPLVVKAVVDGVLLPSAAAPGSAEGLDALAAGAAQRFGVRPALFLAAALSVALTAAGGAASYLRGLLVADASQGILRRLRERLHAQLESLPLTWHDGQERGDLLQRSTSDVDTVGQFLSTQVLELSRIVFLLTIAMPIMLWLDVRMTLISMALYPLVVAFGAVFFRRVRTRFQACDEAEAELTAVLEENLSGVRVVRAFGREALEEERFGARAASYRDRWDELLRTLGGYYAVSDVLCLGQFALVLWFGSRGLAAGELAVGAFAAFTTYAWMLVFPLRQTGRVLGELGKALVSLERIEAVLQEQAEDTGPAREDAPSTAPFRGGLEVEGLCFTYAGSSAPALQDIHFDVAPGETLALLGPPGSGKSTVLHLLLGLYPYEQGSIRLDGVELRDLGTAYARRGIAVAPQDAFLYSRTIEENLRKGLPSATRDELERAVAAADLGPTLEAMPEGFETRVGERGVTLSGGQRQRLSLARALLRDAAVLVLDDTLSAVDARTDERIRRALRARQGQTNLIVTHRLASAADAQQVVVLDAGRVVQRGSPADLLQQAGPFRRLFELQSELDDALGATGEEARS